MDLSQKMKSVNVSFLNRKGSKLKVFLSNKNNTENQIMIFARLVIQYMWLIAFLWFSGLCISTFYLTRSMCSSESRIKTPVLHLSFLFCKAQNLTWTWHSNQFYLLIEGMLDNSTFFLGGIFILCKKPVLPFEKTFNYQATG